MKLPPVIVAPHTRQVVIRAPERAPIGVPAAAIMTCTKVAAAGHAWPPGAPVP
jgi:hypothetical protein